MRPTWDEYFKNVVEVTSTRSPCERLKVGCLLVKDNRIISQGYNGFLPGSPHESIVRDGHEQGTIHAEQNAICDCAKRGASCDGMHSLHNTLSLCDMYAAITCCRCEVD